MLSHTHTLVLFPYLRRGWDHIDAICLLLSTLSLTAVSLQMLRTPCPPPPPPPVLPPPPAVQLRNCRCVFPVVDECSSNAVAGEKRGGGGGEKLEETFHKQICRFMMRHELVHVWNDEYVYRDLHLCTHACYGECKFVLFSRSCKKEKNPTKTSYRKLKSIVKTDKKETHAQTDKETKTPAWTNLCTHPDTT